MNKPKLIRATTPMCPKCGAQMAYTGNSMGLYECLGRYGHPATREPHWGYFAESDEAEKLSRLRAGIRRLLADVPYHGVIYPSDLAALLEVRP